MFIIYHTILNNLRQNILKIFNIIKISKTYDSASSINRSFLILKLNIFQEKWINLQSLWKGGERWKIWWIIECIVKHTLISSLFKCRLQFIISVKCDCKFAMLVVIVILPLCWESTVLLSMIIFSYSINSYCLNLTFSITSLVTT